ncbi:MAG: alpha-1,2-fucosyltransferase [Acidimicrobiales bacterium]
MDERLRRRLGRLVDAEPVQRGLTPVWKALGRVGVVETTPSVAPHIHGGLGNQIFMLATARFHARRTGRQLVLRPRVFNGPPYWDTIFAPLLAEDGVVMLEPGTGLRHVIGPSLVHTEPDYSFSPIPDVPTPSIRLMGFFQSARYFPDEDLSWIARPVAEVAEVSRRILDADSPEGWVFVHVRRGADYRKLPHLHPVVAESYYEEATSRFGPDARFVVSSDDMAWCRRADVFADQRFRFMPDGVSAEVALEFGSRCTGGFVMANSSYSWWSVRLGTADRRVIAPDPWFGPALAGRDLSDMYDPGWERIIWSG